MGGVCTQLLKDDKDVLGTSFDMVCFGHVIFEMALGYELTVARPNVEQLVGKCEYELIELMVFIFYHPDDRVPSVRCKHFSRAACVRARRRSSFLPQTRRPADPKPHRRREQDPAPSPVFHLSLVCFTYPLGTVVGLQPTTGLQVEEVCEQKPFKDVRCEHLEGFHAAPMVFTKEIKQVLRAVAKDRPIK